ncbi:hypothetical protein PR202_ga25161 [Eleusine coracana subsp. coracana]|uniref:NAC domain-containing protein n=1 Tax=Eleusine coracana subsp. coracana TaxID=191504 RepID=A0AAV5D9X9_ELECO|nr:hypothetical protein QOZ80_9AG0670460 [Eleusine coracana subsp. coracana]GJN07337.1 hypothetical protein PR202_ga25161 [Eleusine coracana subsp. coracana]
MDSSSGLQLPPGFRFHPTDEELVMYYLCRKCAALPLAAPVIAEVDLYKFDPWQLPEKSAMAVTAMMGGGDAMTATKEWYFFSPRDRKYPNGSRPNRAAGTGYWKATGADKPVGSPRPVAIKKALVFYAGKPPKGVKTNWIMHEYRLADVDRSAAARKRTNNALRLDDWVLCRIYNKKGVIERYDTVDDDDDDDVKPAAAPANNKKPAAASRGGAAFMKVEMPDYGYYDNYEMMDDDTPPAAEMLCFDRPFFALAPPPEPSSEERDSSNTSSLPHLLHTTTTDNSSSGSDEHVLSPSPDLPDRDHAESQPGGWFDWAGGAADDDGFVIDAGAFFGPTPVSPGLLNVRDAAEMFAYLQRPLF